MLTFIIPIDCVYLHVCLLAVLHVLNRVCVGDMRRGPLPGCNLWEQEQVWCVYVPALCTVSVRAWIHAHVYVRHVLLVVLEFRCFTKISLVSDNFAVFMFLSIHIL